ncbi:unnamed protein product [Lupinus luteus]|uniref:ubiquitinyl hydrolase 1 n=1 Tax=Lupinus luteus TaxID=3873 RepID=A0AAV1WKT7_LUPLU
MVFIDEADVIQWGLHILNGDPSYSTEYYNNIDQDNNSDIYDGPYFQNNHENDSNDVENDEIIARTLQEEFSQLEIDERSRNVQEGEGQFHAPQTKPAYDMHNSAMGNYCPGGESSSELTDNSTRDDEVRSRFSDMTLIPHVPKINGEIPSIDEATSDHQRLLDRLQLYDFVEHKVQGDGNCQFRALSDQLYNAPDHHKFVRRQVVNQLKSNPEIYDGYVPMEYDDYLAKMSKSGEWGDHVTLQAAADKYGVKIFVMTSFKDTCCIEILPNFEKPKRVIFLSFWAEVHYNSIHPRGDKASSESRKKEWWSRSFGSKH